MRRGSRFIIMRHSESNFFSHFLVAALRRAGLRSRLAWLPLAGLLAVAWAGCATGDISLMVPVAGGEKLRVPLGRGGVVPTEENGIRIDSTTLMPTDDKKQAVFGFAFTDAQTRALQSVKVEDISDDAPILIVDDPKPDSVKGRWHTVTRPYDIHEAALKWALQLDKSVRIYRFTAVFADGRKVVLNQGMIYPDIMKVGIRHLFGEKY